MTESPELQRLLEAALQYGVACDEQNYPALHLRTKELKSAARSYRWLIEDMIEQVPERVVTRHSP